MSPSAQYEPEHSILLVDDDAGFLDGARRALLAHGINNVTTLQESSQALFTLSTGAYTVLLLDWVMPDPSGADLLPEIVRQYPDIPVIVMTGVSDLENVVSCIKQGAYDYITKPLDSTRLVSIVQNAVNSNELIVRNRKLTGYLLGEPLSNPEHFSEIITCSEKMFSIFKVIETLASSRQPVLITGETGVGKELIAQAIHRSSGLKGKMVTVNAAGLDDTMLADTLFGHKKGAFTGATESREGLIEQAKGGTLFLDEIGDLSNASQIKLLRLLQQNEYYRLGSDILHKSDARIIAASNGNFQSLLNSRTFRNDLYYRISAHALHIPPLRERLEDIIPLAQHYINKFAIALRLPPPRLSAELRNSFISHDFPGNVREMINMIHNAVTYNRTETLDFEDFPGLAPAATARRKIVRKIGASQFALHGIFQGFPNIEEVEALLVEEAITLSHGNRSIAAKMLGVSRPTLQKKLDRTPEKRSDDDLE
ncbi:MAG: sigma-54 dependent transcriptional regulator [Desulfuromonadaceae bacterium]|nr:sigma-54 dependent transcriptional regulator [Desulfuromonadaceae bacterium]